MTHFSTCTGCKLKPECQKLAGLKSKLAGLGVTSVKHICKARVPEFMPGDPVYIDTISSCDSDGTMGRFPGVIIRDLPGKPQVIAFIAPGTEEVDGGDEFEPKNGGFVKVPRSRVIHGDGPRIDVAKCQHCGDYPALLGKCGSLYGNQMPPHSCLLETQKEAA